MLPNHLARFADKIPVLDHGFLRLVDVMGDDGAIIEAARVSTGKGRTEHKWVERADKRVICAVCNRARVWVSEHDEWAHDPVCFAGDRHFLDYMMRNGHHSPFEMCEIKLHVRMPIFVARQWIRHRTANVNEYSGRYSEMIDDAFVIAPDGWRAQDTVNKQGSADGIDKWPDGYSVSHYPEGAYVHDSPGPIAAADMGNRETNVTPGAYLTRRQEILQAFARAVYAERLAFGVSRELARVDMPLGNYTEWYWKIDLRNLFHFLGLRMDAHAQHEIQVYANAIAEIVQAWCPLAWGAFENHRLHAQTLSGKAAAALRQILEKSGVSPQLSPESLAAHRDFVALDKADREALLRLLDVEGAP